MSKNLFINRWSDKEIKALIKYYDEAQDDKDFEVFDWREDLKSLLLTHGKSLSRKRGREGKIVPPEERLDYIKSYEDYKKRAEKLPFEVLMRDSFDAEVCTQYFRWKDIFIHVLEVPIEEIPLYINSKDSMVSFFARYRLKAGK